MSLRRTVSHTLLAARRGRRAARIRNNTIKAAHWTGSLRWRCRFLQLPGSNALDTANGVYAKMKDLKKSFPDGLDYQIVYDTTPFIRESVNEVFLHAARRRDSCRDCGVGVLAGLGSAMILAHDRPVPVSLIGTFTPSWRRCTLLLNNLTLPFGLVLAIGIVVDDAIVVLENIERLIATGLDARTATIKAMEEITGTGGVGLLRWCSAPFSFLAVSWVV